MESGEVILDREDNMPDNSLIEGRKTDHLHINLENDVQSGLSTGLEKYRFIHEALPDLDLEEVDISQIFLSKRLALPILISSMTGGTAEALQINATLAMIAELSGIAMGVGSQRVALEKREAQSSFQMRKFAPNALLFANLGAVQLNYELGVDDCRRAVEMIEADAIILHLNPLQEALQPEGNTNFKGLLNKIEEVCHSLEVPVIVKEVGWGISANTARKLADAGVQMIDVAGAGGTSWSQVEKYRLKDEHRQIIAGAFKNWGIPTAESILMVAQAAPQVKME
jgi:isopentenyl-diphosphate delta-isomerase